MKTKIFLGSLLLAALAVLFFGRNAQEEKRYAPIRSEETGQFTREP